MANPDSGMDAQPGALADLPLGHQIQSVAESVGAELKAPLNGVGTLLPPHFCQQQC